MQVELRHQVQQTVDVGAIEWPEPEVHELIIRVGAPQDSAPVVAGLAAGVFSVCVRPGQCRALWAGRAPIRFDLAGDGAIGRLGNSSSGGRTLVRQPSPMV